MKVELQPAFVLHSRPYRDSSGLIDIFSQDYGRLTLVAKGYRKSKKPIRALLQPFQKILLSWTGKGELKSLTAVEGFEGNVSYLTGNALISGLYLNELLTYLTHVNDPCLELFSLYDETISHLSDGRSLERTLRIFEKNLLIELGYGLQLTHTVDGEPIEDDARYIYQVESGPVPMHHTGVSGVEVAGSSLLALSNERLDEANALKEIKKLMRIVISYYLGGKKLQSRMLFQKVNVD
jgi:DNA repair protein RecO (recombination protein O)